MKSKIVMTKSGLWALQNPDKSTPFLNKMKECYSIELTKEDVVADIGAYIGEYSTWAADRCRHVYSYEASPETAKVLDKNCRSNMTIVNRAVTGGDQFKAQLFLSKGIGATNSIAKTRAKAGSIWVPTIRYDEAVENCTVVKIDVEGAEYSYNIPQPQLRAIILEVHPVEGDWKAMAEELFEKIQAAGFKMIMRPQFQNGWDMHATFERVAK